MPRKNLQKFIRNITILKGNCSKYENRQLVKTTKKVIHENMFKYDTMYNF